MKITNDINYTIFREYDIRGIYDEDLHDDVIYTIGRAFGSKLKELNIPDAIIGYDNKSSSPRIFEILSKGIIESGTNVISLGLVTTPMYYYALTYLNKKGGMMITASHNPKEYNGLKYTTNGKYNNCGDEIKEFIEYIKKGKFEKGLGTINEFDIKEIYINYLLKNIKTTNKKIIIDCGNGTGSFIIKDIFNRLDMDVEYLYCESNPEFPNHQPDPSEPKNMLDLQKRVIETNADLGIAIDGDADRLGIVDELGNIIGNDILMIIYIRDILKTTDDKRIIYDVKCSKTLEDEILKAGGILIQNRTGNSYQRKKIFELGNMFAGEFSGHIYFADKFHGFDDGIYAGLRLIEIMSKTNKSVSTLLENINHYYSTEENIEVKEENKFKIVDSFKEYITKKGYKYLDIDGFKVLFDDGFALIRASNTTPIIRTRYEANTEKRLKEIQEEFDGILKKLT